MNLVAIGRGRLARFLYKPDAGYFSGAVTAADIEAVSARGNTLLEICTRISGYQGHQPDIRGKINGYQEKIRQISNKYLTGFSTGLKNTCSIYLNISQISVTETIRE